VSDIRDSAEQQIQLAVVGSPELRADVIRALYIGPTRYPSPQRANIAEYDVPLPHDQQTNLGRADAVLFVIDASGPISREAAATADKLSMLGVPKLALLVGTEQLPTVQGDATWYLAGMTTVFAPDTQPETLAKRFVPAVVDLLPEDLRIAAARKLPALRDGVGRWLVGDVSFSNASFALTSGIPEMVPLLNIPLNAADMFVLTKNQALLVYKLALAFGAPPDFQAQMREVLPVVGSGFLWRQVARQLVGLIPGFGILPKVAVAYAGTFATGQAAVLWYRNGETLSNDALKGLYRQAMQIGRQRAADLVKRQPELPPATGEIQPVAPRKRWWHRFRRPRQ
jgi:uncharacterized protein (DUF697 family)